MEREHNVPKPLKRALHPDGTPCQDCLTKEEVLVGHTDKIERLELEITGLLIDIKTVKDDNHKLSEEKNRAENAYQEASRVIADQQRKLTEALEKANVMANLAQVADQERDIVSTDKSKPKEW